MDEEPYQPSGKARKVKSKDIGDSRRAADYRHIALVEIVEGPRLGLFLNAGADHLRGIGAALHRDLSHSRQRLSIGFRGQRQVAYHKNVGMVWHGEPRRYQDPADAIGRVMNTPGRLPAELVRG